MPGRMVTRQEKDAMSLEAAAFRFAPLVGPASDLFWASILAEGEPLPQTDEERILALGRWLVRSRERVVEADDAYDEALRARHDVISERDEAATKLRQTILEVRRNFEGVYGAGKTAKMLGLVPDITDEAVLLKRYARAAVKKMRQPGYELPVPDGKMATIQAADVVARIAPDLEALEGFVARIDDAKRFVQTMLREKEAAAIHLGRANLTVARYLEALFVLIGEDFYAERVRQSSHVSAEPEPLPEPDGGPTAEPPIEPPEVGDVEPPAILGEDLDATVETGSAEP